MFYFPWIAFIIFPLETEEERLHTSHFTLHTSHRPILCTLQ